MAKHSAEFLESKSARESCELSAPRECGAKIVGQTEADKNMDPRAATRMKELVDAAVAAFIAAEGSWGAGWSDDPGAQKFIGFIEKHYGQYSSNPRDDAYYSIFRICLDLGLNEPGKAQLKPGLVDRTKEIAEGVFRFWSSVPRTYLYRFPLISLKKTPADVAPVDCGYGITLDIEGDPRGKELSALARMWESPAIGPSLAIEAKGFSLFAAQDDVCGQTALGSCKVVVALGRVLGVFDTDTTWGISPVEKARQRDDAGNQDTDVYLTPDFGRALSRVVFTRSALIAPKSLLQDAHERQATELHKHIAPRLQQIGAVIGRARQHLTTKESPNATEKQKHEIAGKEHCARIVTAAEWLFDASSGARSAMSYVQLAIGFEALFGGTSEDPVVETLSNRLVYSLASNAGERSYLARRFRAFYKQRSHIVHHGTSRLMPDEAELYDWGMTTLRRALSREISLAMTG